MKGLTYTHHITKMNTIYSDYLLFKNSYSKYNENTKYLFGKYFCILHRAKI